MDFYRRIQYLIDFDDMDLCIQKKPEQDLVRSRCNFVYGIHAVTVVSADLPLDSERRLGCLVRCCSIRIPCFMRIILLNCIPVFVGKKSGSGDAQR